MLISSRLAQIVAGREADRELSLDRGSDFATRVAEAFLEQDGFREWWNYTDRRVLSRPIIELLEELD